MAMSVVDKTKAAEQCQYELARLLAQQCSSIQGLWHYSALLALHCLSTVVKVVLSIPALGSMHVFRHNARHVYIQYLSADMKVALCLPAIGSVNCIWTRYSSCWNTG